MSFSNLRTQVCRAGLLILALGAGCQEMNRTKSRPTTSARAMTTDDVLDRCVAAYGRVKSLRVIGVLRDNRQDERRMQPIRWELERPDKCRLQIGTNVSIVVGQAYWNYDSQSHKFKRARLTTRTPMETTGYVMTRGVSFLLPTLFERDEAAFGRSRARGYVDWRLTGVAWLDEHPCYVVCRKEGAGGKELTRRVWVDQDSYLVRAWDLVEPGADGRDNILVAETMHEMTVNQPIPANMFSVEGAEEVEEGTDGTEQR